MAKSTLFCALSLFMTSGIMASVAQAEAGRLTLYYVANSPVICGDVTALSCLGGWLAVEAAKRSGLALEIKELPWKRAIADLNKDPDALFIASGRSLETEALFSWVVPLFSDDTWLVWLGNSRESGARPLHVGVKAGSPFALAAAQHGWRSDEFENWESLTRTLIAGRVDAVYATRAVLVSNVIARLPKELHVNSRPVESMTWWVIRSRRFAESANMQRFREAAETLEQSADYFERVKKISAFATE